MEDIWTCRWRSTCLTLIYVPTSKILEAVEKEQHGLFSGSPGTLQFCHYFSFGLRPGCLNLFLEETGVNSLTISLLLKNVNTWHFILATECFVFILQVSHFCILYTMWEDSLPTAKNAVLNLHSLSAKLMPLFFEKQKKSNFTGLGMHAHIHKASTEREAECILKTAKNSSNASDPQRSLSERRSHRHFVYCILYISCFVLLSFSP